jgi:hypothetical protein
MPNVFILDTDKDLAVYNKVKLLVGENNVDVESSIDIALSRATKKKYDLLVIVDGNGKSNLLDFADVVIQSRALNHADILILEKSLPITERIVRLFRGRRVYRFKRTELDLFNKTLESMLK